MAISREDELKASIQNLIEQRVPSDNWKRAFGRIEPHDSGEFHGHWVNTINPIGTESLKDSLSVQTEINKLLQAVNKSWCKYELVCGETIQFEFTE